MKMTIFRKAGMQAAMLALCASALYAMPMMAQDTAPPATSGRARCAWRTGPQGRPGRDADQEAEPDAGPGDPGEGYRRRHDDTGEGGA